MTATYTLTLKGNQITLTPPAAGGAVLGVNNGAPGQRGRSFLQAEVFTITLDSANSCAAASR